MDFLAVFSKLSVDFSSIHGFRKFFFKKISKSKLHRLAVTEIQGTI